MKLFSGWPGRSVPWMAFLAALFFRGAEAFAAGGKTPDRMLHVADTRGMKEGVSKWIADVYNTDLLLFGLLVVAVMVVLGTALGFLFDRLIGRLGIRLEKLDRHE